MGYSFSNSKNSLRKIHLDKIGTSIVIRKVDGTVITEVCSVIINDDELEADPISKGITNGILLTLSAFLTEGMSDQILEDTELLEHCLKCAIERVPSLASQLSE